MDLTTYALLKQQIGNTSSFTEEDAAKLNKVIQDVEELSGQTVNREEFAEMLKSLVDANDNDKIDTIEEIANWISDEDSRFTEKLATDPMMEDWTAGKVVDAAVLKNDFENAMSSLNDVYDQASFNSNDIDDLQLNKADKPFEIHIIEDGEGGYTTQETAEEIFAHAENCVVIDENHQQIEKTAILTLPDLYIIRFSYIDATSMPLNLLGYELISEPSTIFVINTEREIIELPDVSASDNGKSLYVVNGTWAAQAGPAAVTEQTVAEWGFTKNTGTYNKPGDGIPKTDLAEAVQTSLGKADTALQSHQSLTAYRTASAQDTIDEAQNTEITAKYTKPSTGIPKSDLAAAVQASLDKADTALQSHQSLSGYATEQWVESKGYLTQHQDISGKADASDVAALVSRLNAIADSDDTTLDQLSEIVAYIKNNKSLIDNITTGKVSVSDIVDNLTSSATNKPLSANQGRALKALIDAIVVPTESTVSGWGFTKNTGTYSKPSSGIPKSDLAQAVQTSLGKADTALQQHQSLSGYATETWVGQQIAAIPDELPSGGSAGDFLRKTASGVAWQTIPSAESNSFGGGN